MLTGKQTFHGETTSDTLAGVLRAEPDWSALPTDTPPRIHRLLRRCLERDCKQRLRDIGEARIMINAREEEVTSSSPPSRAWIAVAAVFTFAFFVAAIGWWRATRPVDHPLVRFSTELLEGPNGSLRLEDTILSHGQPGTFLALSPDGARLAIQVRDADGKPRLATRRFDESR